jgi:hypothetical protein
MRKINWTGILLLAVLIGLLIALLGCGPVDPTDTIISTNDTIIFIIKN